jgi:hypothetical protein
MFSSATKSAAQGGGYNLTKSLRFRGSASAYLSRTPSVNGNRKTWTFSAWLKRGTIQTSSLFTTYINTDNSVGIFFGGDNLEVSFYETSRIGWVISNAVFRDPSAWYHLVVNVDTTQSTASNRIKAYINGLQITSLSQAIYPNQNADLLINSTNQHLIGKQNYPGFPHYFDGYMTEINFIDGQALTPSSFGSTNGATGVWQPAKYIGTYGTNGFYLPFTNTASTTTLGYDSSGNSNNWTTNNFSLTTGVNYDSMNDVPTLTSETVANYCVLNILQNGMSVNGTLSDANLKFSCTGSDNRIGGSLAVSTGKWYYEVTTTAIGTGTWSIGISKATSERTSNYQNLYWNGYFWEGDGYKQIITNGVDPSTPGSAPTYTTNDVIGFAYDLDNGTITAYKNNVSTVTWTGITLGVNYIPSFYVNNSAAMACNFGQRPFVYTPPSGYKALNTYNLPNSTIVKGNNVMDATTYTGTLLSNNITNTASFKPDLVWVKSRSASTDNKLTDSVRGVTKGLISNTSGAETTDTQGLTAFNSNGFTVGTNTDYNNLTSTYVGWQWQAGQGSTSSNTNGSITSTVSVNATAGCSIVTYTGTGSNATVGHGLGVAPKFIIVRVRSASNDWRTYFASLGNTGGVVLNSSVAFVTDSSYWNNTNPTSSVFSVGTNTGTNANGQTFVAYCWSEIAGFSQFGSYTGNNSIDGPFVYTGFRPKFVLFKAANNASGWQISDSTRSPFNVSAAALFPNVSNAEYTIASDVAVDFLSNGFKLRGQGGETNYYSGGNYIYAAFAENPFKNALAR